MTTHTDGTSPSVGSPDDDADGAAGNGLVFGPDASTPRPRDPAPGTPPPHPDAPLPGSGRRAASGDGNGSPGWLQHEIQRRVAASAGSDTGRHSRSDRGRTAPGDDTPPPRAVGGPPGTPRRRSTRMPDPYAPDGMRAFDDESFRPEQAFRMPGPAAAAPEARASVTDTAAPRTPPKQWPPADGAAGLPRRVPGTGWTLDRRLLDDTDATDDPDPETRIVPVQWAAARTGRTAEPEVRPAVDYHDDYDDDYDEDDDDFAETGLVTGDTEVIWRAPGLDDLAPAPSDGAPSPAPYTGALPRRFAGAPTDLEPVGDVATDTAATDTAATDAVPVAEPGRGCPDLDDAPQDGRRRIVLSERRTVAHSVRTVVDVQDPGTVGSMWRSQLVTSQLRVALQVGVVALIALVTLPALFAAFPVIGEISVFGLRLPWVVLGFLIYPFLLVLGWWFVGSAERVEQEFAQEVQDR